MKPLAWIATVGLCALTTSATTGRAAEPTAPAAWGHPADGLRLSVALVPALDPAQKDADIEVGFENVGTEDKTLNLGMLLANGHLQEPDAVRLDVTDAKGKSMTFDLCEIGAIAGRVDDYVVPLRHGSTFCFRVSSRHYLSLQSMGTIAELPAGHYTLTAHFEGKGAQLAHQNGDLAGIALMNFWKGGLDSNAVSFEVGKG